MSAQAYRAEEEPDMLLDDIANRTVDAIRALTRGFHERPHRGAKRDDLRPGLRIIPFKKRTAIAFEVDEARRVVTILRVFYGGQNYETVMSG